MHLQKRFTNSYLAVLLTTLVAMILVSMNIGAMRINLVSIIKQAMAGIWQLEARVLLNIRLPRIVFALITGFSLSLAGAVLQSLFRNDLVDPGLIGISSGASFAVTLAIVLNISAVFLRPLAAFVGGIAAASVIFSISKKGGNISVSTLILSGIAINAIFGAATGFLIFVANNDQLRDITFWTMGSLGGVQWEQVIIALPLSFISGVLLLGLCRSLNAMHLGEQQAGHLGVRVERVKKITLLFSVLSVSTMVAFTGVIGFIGLVAPHISRRIVGFDNRILLPASGILGALLLLLADTLSRTIIAPAELPIGIITAVIGGPFFLILILRHRSAL